MKLLFRQRFFSWFDSYDIYDENENTVYTVKGQLSWGHCLKIYDVAGREVGTVKERVFTFLPKFELYEGPQYIGCLSWEIQGSFMEWDYTIATSDGRKVAVISKELFHMTDTYILDIADPKDALHVLMFVLAIDAEKCSRNRH